MIVGIDSSIHPDSKAKGDGRMITTIEASASNNNPGNRIRRVIAIDANLSVWNTLPVLIAAITHPLTLGIKLYPTGTI